MEAILSYFNSLSIEHYAIIGLFIFFFLVYVRNNYKKKRSDRKLLNAPQLQLGSYQIAPLGLDATFLIMNEGNSAHLHHVKVSNRKDVQVKNEVFGHEIKSGETYRIMMESEGVDKITNNLIMEMVFSNGKGQFFKQVTPMNAFHQTYLLPIKKIR
ncbi:MAG: hypothetical protein AAFO07_25735 [Bacteroidota bacterium]